MRSLFGDPFLRLSFQFGTLLRFLFFRKRRSACRVHISFFSATGSVVAPATGANPLFQVVVPAQPISARMACRILKREVVQNKRIATTALLVRFQSIPACFRLFPMLGAGDSNHPVRAGVIFGHILANVDEPISGTHSMYGSQVSNDSPKPNPCGAWKRAGFVRLGFLSSD